jgi:hypothetical protein
VPDYRMLWKGTALNIFAHFSNINTNVSNVAELRRQSRHVFGLPMENRRAITRRDVASELPHSNKR